MFVLDLDPETSVRWLCDYHITNPHRDNPPPNLDPEWVKEYYSALKREHLYRFGKPYPSHLEPFLTDATIKLPEADFLDLVVREREIYNSLTLKGKRFQQWAYTVPPWWWVGYDKNGWSFPQGRLWCPIEPDQGENTPNHYVLKTRQLMDQLMLEIELEEETNSARDWLSLEVTRPKSLNSASLVRKEWKSLTCSELPKAVLDKAKTLNLSQKENWEWFKEQAAIATEQEQDPVRIIRNRGLKLGKDIHTRTAQAWLRKGEDHVEMKLQELGYSHVRA